MGAQTDTATLDERDLVTHQYHLRVVEALVAERNRYRDAITDALADLRPGYAPYSVLADALKQPAAGELGSKEPHDA